MTKYNDYKIDKSDKKINITFTLNELYELMTAVNFYRSKNGEVIRYGQRNEYGRDYAGYILDQYLKRVIVHHEKENTESEE
jgi:hypothetical protein